MSLYPEWLTENVEMIEVNQYEVKVGKGYKYDFDNHKVIVSITGKTKRIDEHKSYLYWVWKCIQTERFKYAAYGSDFGVELETIIEQDYEQAVAESEIARTITEALSIDDRTVSVTDFTFEWDVDGVRIKFQLESIYDTDLISLKRGGLSG